MCSQHSCKFWFLDSFYLIRYNAANLFLKFNGFPPNLMPLTTIEPTLVQTSKIGKGITATSFKLSYSNFCVWLQNLLLFSRFLMAMRFRGERHVSFWILMSIKAFCQCTCVALWVVLVELFNVCHLLLIACLFLKCYDVFCKFLFFSPKVKNETNPKVFSTCPSTYKHFILCFKLLMTGFDIKAWKIRR